MPRDAGLFDGLGANLPTFPKVSSLSPGGKAQLLETMPEIPDDVFLPDLIDEPAEDEAVMPEADKYTPEAYDEYLTAELLLSNMGTVVKAKVTGRKRDAGGNPIGKRYSNPMLDTRESMKSSFQTERQMCLRRISLLKTFTLKSMTKVILILS